MLAARHQFGFKDTLRRLAGLALVVVGAGLFVTVFGHRGYIDIFEMRMVVAEASGTSVWLSEAVWAEMLDGALFPSIWLFAAAGPGGLLLVRAGRRWVRRVGSALILWTASVAMLAFPPFLTRPDFDPAPWSPFLIALAVGVVPGALLVAGAGRWRKLRVASEIATG
ncbi:MAG: hypothetical protein OEQ29_10960 [Alphaproteobacteria bacterium]|nr:hypothetical protein [Alphaproteobacteria bacterium]